MTIFEEGLLYNKLPTWTSSSDVANLHYITDGDFRSEGNIRTTKVRYELDEVYNINKIALKYYNDHGAYVRFYDKDMNELASYRSRDIDSGLYRNDTSSPTYTNVNIPNVKYVELDGNANRSNHTIIRAFNVFGNPAPANRVMLLADAEYLYYDKENKIWKPLSNINPVHADYKSHGITDLSVLNKEELLIIAQYYKTENLKIRIFKEKDL